MKPHEETWHMGRHVVVNAEGKSICRMQGPASTLAAQELILAAPEMARALLGLQAADGCIDECGNGGEDPEDCSPRCAAVARALKKAGVL